MFCGKRAHSKPSHCSSSAFGQGDPTTDVVALQSVHQVLALESVKGGVSSERVPRDSCTQVATHARFDSNTNTAVDSSSPGIFLVDCMCAMTNLCVSLTSAGRAHKSAARPRAEAASAVCAHLSYAARLLQDTVMSERHTEQPTDLRQLLLGSPLNQREAEQRIKEELNSHLQGLLELIPRVYGALDPAQQAIAEVRRVAELDNIPCKRAMLLYGLFAEQEVFEHFKSSSKHCQLADDLKYRVLPFVFPAFFKESCQSPATFVLLTMMLAEMWGGETLGNWPSAP